MHMWRERRDRIDSCNTSKCGREDLCSSLIRSQQGLQGLFLHIRLMKYAELAVAEWVGVGVGVGVGFGLPKQFALYRRIHYRAAMQYIMCVLRLAVLDQWLPIQAAYKQSNCTHYQQNIAIIPIHSTYSTRGMT